MERRGFLGLLAGTGAWSFLSAGPLAWPVGSDELPVSPELVAMETARYLTNSLGMSVTLNRRYDDRWTR